MWQWQVEFSACVSWRGKWSPMRPKAKRLAQHGGPPGWLEESYPAGVILYVMDGPYRLPFPHRTGCPDRSFPAASNHAIMEFPDVQYTLHNHSSWATSRKEGMAWYSQMAWVYFLSVPTPHIVLRKIWKIFHRRCYLLLGKDSHLSFNPSCKPRLK